MLCSKRISTGIVIAAALMAVVGGLESEAKAQRRGRPMGDPALDVDREMFHFLLDHRQAIQRKVTKLQNGVETLTESEDPEVSERIQRHVEAMHKRLTDRRPIHMRDPLFAEVFRNADKIKMKLERTQNGIKATETSDDPYVVKLIQAHAEVVDLFTANGRAEMRKNHEAPARETQSP